MSMPLAHNQSAIGQNLYYFDCGDRTVDWCLLLAHGGFDHSTPTFTVPLRCHLYFYTDHLQNTDWP